MTAVEKAQRRATRAASELERLEAKLQSGLTLMVKTGVRCADLAKATKRAERRRDRAIEAVRQLNTPPRRAKARPIARPDSPKTAGAADNA